MKQLMIVGALALAACEAPVEMPAEPPLPSAETDTCDATDYAALVGANVAAVTLPADQNIRVYPEDSIVTQEYMPDRLNVVTDGDGVILRLRCG